jgi:hypothetical protein
MFPPKQTVDNYKLIIAESRNTNAGTYYRFLLVNLSNLNPEFVSISNFVTINVQKYFP